MKGGGDKLLSRIKSTYVDSIACFRVKIGDSEWFRINNGVRSVSCPLSFSLYIWIE